MMPSVIGDAYARERKPPFIATPAFASAKMGTIR
jgi:hypothetical protein